MQTRWKEIHHPKTRRKGFNLKNLVTFWKTHPARFPDHLQTRQIEKLILQGKAPPTPVQVQEIEQLLLDSASGSTRRECPAHLPSPASRQHDPGQHQVPKQEARLQVWKHSTGSNHPILFTNQTCILCFCPDFPPAVDRAAVYLVSLLDVPESPLPPSDPPSLALSPSQRPLNCVQPECAPSSSPWA